MLLPTVSRRYGYFDLDAMAGIGAAHHAAYAAAKPFPSIVFDDFLDPRILKTCLAHFPTRPDPDTSSFDGKYERRKRGYLPERLHPNVRSIFYAFNSRPFIAFLEALTGIKGLIPDPYFRGGGFHELSDGGHLSVHADFNFHPVLKLERRINALIYLNKNWREEYGGVLELWASGHGPCVRRIVPEFNRAVIFNTATANFHGNPDPVRHPKGLPRRSIALYYYTATWNESSLEHSTIFAETLR
ncbi:MAG: 2OG-Fe(II) oxygenase [Alphaproteobacteria bacterium]